MVALCSVYWSTRESKTNEERDNSIVRDKELVLFNKKSKKYQFFITDGDLWLEKKHWHNAIFQYKKALEVSPNEYDANYRLLVAYSKRCIYKNRDCSLGIELAEKIRNKYPSELEIEQFQELFKNKGL